MSTGKGPSPYLRRLNVPPLEDTRLASQLSKHELADAWLPPEVADCRSDPLLWDLAGWPSLTVRDVALRLVTAMLKLSHNDVQVASKGLVIQLKMWQLLKGSCIKSAAAVEQWQHTLKLVSGVTKGSAITNSVKAAAAAAEQALKAARDWYKDLSPERQYELKAEALFQNPPVVGRNHTKYYTSCWPIRRYNEKDQPRCV